MFLRHVHFDSGFYVMTIYEVSCSKNLLSLHHQTTMSLGMGLKKTRLIFLEDFFILLLGLGDPG